MNPRIVLVSAAVFALAACGEAKKPDAAASQAPKMAEAAPAPSAAAPAGPAAAGAKPTKEFVAGKWGNDGDCALAMELKADGTSDGPFGKWAYSDGVITFPEAPEMKIAVTVAADGKSMDSVNAQGGKHQMTPCP